MPKPAPPPAGPDPFAHDPELAAGIPVKDWIPTPVFDSADYLDRPDPVYLDQPEEDPSAPNPT